MLLGESRLLLVKKGPKLFLNKVLRKSACLWRVVKSY